MIEVVLSKGKKTSKASRSVRAWEVPREARRNLEYEAN